jgi:hypothetical protein
MNKRMKIGLGAAAALLLAGGAAVYAQESGEHGPMRMFDADGDGVITRAEVRAAAATMFAGADVNKDGQVTREEMLAFHDKMGGHHRGPPDGMRGPPPGEPHADGGPVRLDSDGNGSISLAEAQDGMERHFAMVDTDKNGAVTREEMEAAHRDHHPR